MSINIKPENTFEPVSVTTTLTQMQPNHGKLANLIRDPKSFDQLTESLPEERLEHKNNDIIHNIMDNLENYSNSSSNTISIGHSVENNNQVVMQQAENRNMIVQKSPYLNQFGLPIRNRDDSYISHNLNMLKETLQQNDRKQAIQTKEKSYHDEQLDKNAKCRKLIMHGLKKRKRRKNIKKGIRDSDGVWTLMKKQKRDNHKISKKMEMPVYINPVKYIKLLGWGFPTSLLSPYNDDEYDLSTYQITLDQYKRIDSVNYNSDTSIYQCDVQDRYLVYESNADIKRNLDYMNYCLQSTNNESYYNLSLLLTKYIEGLVERKSFNLPNLTEERTYYSRISDDTKQYFKSQMVFETKYELDHKGESNILGFGFNKKMLKGFGVTEKYAQNKEDQEQVFVNLIGNMYNIMSVMLQGKYSIKGGKIVDHNEMMEQVKEQGMGHLNDQPSACNDMAFMRGDDETIKRYYILTWDEIYSEDMRQYKINYRMQVDF